MQVLFRQVHFPDLQMVRKIEKTFRYFRKPDFKRQLKWVLAFVLLLIIVASAGKFMFPDPDKARFEELENRIRQGESLDPAARVEFCQLLQKIKGIYLENCEELPLDSLLPRIQCSDYQAVVGTSTTNNYSKTFFNAYPHLKGKVNIHHAVEQNVLKNYPNLFSAKEIHSLENLRGISNAINGTLHLSNIRIEWRLFYNKFPNATREEILKQATYIDRKYGRFFTPSLECN
jgi:hypothetical protein